ncbi:uncharacterized protein LOC130740471 [Lotus japonicus]|uniref:uncharacterized protein LOC130740471 n=1 Tax=Lotus japonicus TaxID=34305 RepID=UPI00258D7DCA|nr:uncharacterized protein LOC130740471 [Lotus japonicus]
MQQRSATSSSRCSGDVHRAIINIGAKRKRNTDDDSLDGLPLYHLRRAATGKREIPRPRTPPAEKWIHAIPVLVLLCLFTLWCISIRVDVEIKDGRITDIRESVIPVPNDNRIDITILAAATASSPFPSIPLNLSGENEETYLIPASSPN